MGPDRDMFEQMSLRELTDLQDHIGQVMRRRFEREAVVVFVDLVGSTEYVVRHGAVAGRAQIQKAHDLLSESIRGTKGRVVDTAGDGAFCIFTDVVEAAECLIELQRLAAAHSSRQERASRLQFRGGLHIGSVLADAERVTGDAVHYASRVQATADPGTIRVSEAAHRSLPARLRTRCAPLAPQPLKGFPEPALLYRLDWRDPTQFPRAVENCATGEILIIPVQERVSFGRLVSHQGRAANDVVLMHPDPDLARRVSRWHFELLRGPDAWELRVLSRSGLRLDDAQMEQGASALVRNGSVVEIGGVLRLCFLADAPGPDDATYFSV
ncbi:MAG: adenylate/guanylate cyclase domain-containing protein [Myxococcota bacterium]|nr:adenylate/guanylate cyclase domain-containing protein [Myxococcota bacterium]